jgi:hypothetical protein
MDTSAATLALSLQRALLGAVTPNMRAVYARRDRNEIVITFVFDGDISADDVETTGIVSTEVISDFPDPDITVTENLIHTLGSAPLVHQGHGRLAYLRKE